MIQNPINKLLQSITKSGKFNETIFESIREKIIIKKFSKKELLFPEPGLYFFSSGLARGYYEKDDKDVTTFLFKNDDIFLFYNVSIQNTPFIEVIEFLENTILVYISKESLNELFEKYPEANSVFRCLAESNLNLYLERILSLKNHNAEQRLREFIDKYTDLYMRVPHKIIASFLGITAETASRILQKKQNGII